MAVLRALATADPGGRYHCVRLLHQFEHAGHVCLAFEPLAMNLKELQDKFGETALHWAILRDHPGVVALLCAAPGAAAAFALRNNYGQTPLALAISMGRAACEAMLRAHGATE